MDMLLGHHEALMNKLQASVLDTLVASVYKLMCLYPKIEIIKNIHL